MVESRNGVARGAFGAALRVVRAGLAVAIYGMVPFGAFAQTASEITPPSFEPAPQRLEGRLVFSGEPGLTAPEGADRLSITISGVDIEGELPGMGAATARTATRLTGRTIRVSEIFEAAAELEAAYVEAGFILARVVLPAQQLDDGDRLRLVVVDGFVESIDDTAVPEQVRDRLQALTSALIGRTGLRRDELERRLLLAGDTYGISLASALTTGVTPAGTVIILQPSYRQVTGFVGFDNFQTEELGGYSLNFGAELNGFLGFGDVFYVRGAAHPDDVLSDLPRNRTIALGAVLPVGTDGLSFGFEYSKSATTPDNPFVMTTSSFERLSFRAFYPVVRGRDLNVVVRGSLDLQEDELDVVVAGVDDLPVYRDRTSVLRAAADVAWRGESGIVLEAGADLSFGLDVLNARSAREAATSPVPLSRAGADAEFSKLELSAGLSTVLGDTAAVSVIGAAQISFGEALLTSEQFNLAGFQALSAFESGTLSGDSGWYIRGEVSRDFDVMAGDMPFRLSPYAFAAGGALQQEMPIFGEAAEVNASSYGLGMDVLATRDEAFTNASVRLEVARGYRDDGEEDGLQISVFGSLRF